MFHGVGCLGGAAVSACDLRAGAAMIIAALAAQGESVIDHVHFIERGYDHIVEKLASLGADIRVRTDPESD